MTTIGHRLRRLLALAVCTAFVACTVPPPSITDTGVGYRAEASSGRGN